MPNPRLTGLGCGLFCAATMFVLACLDRLLFGASPTVYGALFLLVSALTAVWVRRGDLAGVPVVVPIAFAAGLPPLTGPEGGLGAHLMGLLTALAVQAGWLYGGTLVAGLIVTVRKVRLMARKAAERQAAQGGRGPGVQGGRGPTGQDGRGPEARGQGVHGGRGRAMAAHVQPHAAQPTARPRPRRRPRRRTV